MLINLDIPPGLSANGSSYTVGQRGRWWRGNLIRFQAGLLAPVGGWRRVSASPLAGVARGMHAWRDNLLRRRLAIGTTQALYIYSDTGAIATITPSGYIPGRVDGVYADGFGYGPYGASTYGTPRVSSASRLLVAASTWSLDNWGENLVACANHDGKIYEWTPGTAAALVVTNAPTNNLALTVTPERHLVALGAAGNPRLVQWSDRENNTLWAPASTNLAGSLELQTQGVIQCALKVRGETLVLTDQDAHSMRFVGSPLVYGFERVGSACGTLGQKAAIAADGWAAWMGTGGFFVYDGVIRELPSDVYDYVFSDINLDQRSKVHAGLNGDFSEVWWFYCSKNATEIDRYVIWNYVEQNWSVGELSRTSWAPIGVFNKPQLVGVDGHLYEHETGWTANGTAIGSARYVESGALSIAEGDRTMTVLKMLPDERTLGDTRVRFKTRLAPNDSERTYGPYPLSAFTDLRFQARQVSLRVEGVADADWRIGLPRFDVTEGGRR
jgi:hypothetical protein